VSRHVVLVDTYQYVGTFYCRRLQGKRPRIPANHYVKNDLRKYVKSHKWVMFLWSRCILCVRILLEDFQRKFAKALTSFLPASSLDGMAYWALRYLTALYQLHKSCGIVWNKKITLYNVGFEVYTAVIMKSIIFWDISPCSPLSVNRRFGGTYRLHLRLALNRLHGVISQKMIIFNVIQ
jgi:hypothetical protein